MAIRPTETEAGSGNEPPVLAISPEKICFVIVKAREFDVKDAVTEPDTGSNPSDDRMIAVLEDHGDDPVVEELTSFISNLAEDLRRLGCEPIRRSNSWQAYIGFWGAARAAHRAHAYRLSSS
jgi:hypothetical protein